MLDMDLYVGHGLSLHILFLGNFLSNVAQLISSTILSFESKHCTFLFCVPVPHLDVNDMWLMGHLFILI